MSKFAVIAFDRSDSGGLRGQVRADHLDYMRAVEDKVLFGGPLLDDAGRPIGTLFVADFPDSNSAARFIASEPYNVAGLFSEIRVCPWKQVA